MHIRAFWNSLRTPEHRLAWIVALAADAAQITFFPLFAEGAFLPADTVLDVLVGALLIRLLGWHWAFLPTFAAELIPGFDLFPTWTAAVFFFTRHQLKPG